MSKSEKYLFKIYLQLELKRLLLVNRVLNANDYANIREYSAVLQQIERGEKGNGKNSHRNDRNGSIYIGSNDTVKFRNMFFSEKFYRKFERGNGKICGLKVMCMKGI